ncbi:catalase-related domain-containing protein [Actinomycetes bacterium NPDC127524]
MRGLKEAEQEGKEYTPHFEGWLIRESIDRRNDFKQDGETYNQFEEREKDELISNLVSTLAPCDKRIQKQKSLIIVQMMIRNMGTE